MRLAGAGRIGSRLAAGAAAAALLVATPLAAQTAQDGAAPAGPARDWTILVYMAADNNLEQFSLRDMDEIEAGLPEGGRVEVLALVDRSADYSTAASDWQDARLYRLLPDRERGYLNSEVVAELGEVNTGDPKLLADTMARVFREHPARRHAVFLWNHGNGWAGMADDELVPGAPGEHDSLTLGELGQGLRDGMKAAGIAKLDIVGFDMCVMSQLEVAVELADIAEVMVASQAIEPGDGWAYDRFLQQLAVPETDARALAARIVEDYHAFYDEQGDRRERRAARCWSSSSPTPRRAGRS